MVNLLHSPSPPCPSLTSLSISTFLFTFYLLLSSSPSITVLAKLVSSPSAPKTTVLPSNAATVVGFYNEACPQAESIVLSVVQKRFLIDKTITPALLRMLFHDSFVRGTDASIMLDSKPGHEAEKEALPNLTIRGFDLIDDIKSALEAACPGIVSCADILVLATRDSVFLAGGPKFDVPTGRLDGKMSVKEEALTLPSPAFPVEQSRESFIEKGLDSDDMVALLGAHTVGAALCGFFNDRLFNFHGTGAADPNMNTSLVNRLSTVCPNPFFTESNADPPIDLDQSTPHVFDSNYFRMIQSGNGILQIDQEITADPSTASLVAKFTSADAFFPAFARSLVKMSNIGVLTGPGNPLGEVRRRCNVSNPHSLSGSGFGPGQKARPSSSRSPRLGGGGGGAPVSPLGPEPAGRGGRHHEGRSPGGKVSGGRKGKKKDGRGGGHGRKSKSKSKSKAIGTSGGARRKETPPPAAQVEDRKAGA